MAMNPMATAWKVMMASMSMSRCSQPSSFSASSRKPAMTAVGKRLRRIGATLSRRMLETSTAVPITPKVMMGPHTPLFAAEKSMPSYPSASLRSR